MAVLVCDPQAGIKSYTIVGLPGITDVAAQADGSLRVDVSSVPVGTYSVKVSACNGMWCSLPAPFDFSRPAVGVPMNLKLLAG